MLGEVEEEAVLEMPEDLGVGSPQAQRFVDSRVVAQAVADARMECAALKVQHALAVRGLLPGKDADNKGHPEQLKLQYDKAYKRLSLLLEMLDSTADAELPGPSGLVIPTVEVTSRA